MTIPNNHIKKTVSVLIDITSSAMTVGEALGRIDSIRATGRYSEIYIDHARRAIVGVN